MILSKKIFFHLFLLLFVPSLFAETNSSVFATSSQMILVTTKDWDAVPGTLCLFERDTPKASWHEVQTNPIVVGRSGLAWGDGINDTNGATGPVKREGDGKSPAGIFRLGPAFGLASAKEVKSIKLPYQPLLSTIECVDDGLSKHYNSIVDRTKVPKVDWNSSEKMRAIGEQYRLGIVVEHNTRIHHPGGGSCIFLHIWKNAKTGTSGCTAMNGNKMEKLIGRLDPAKQPVLVQLPENEYQRLKEKWELP